MMRRREFLGSAAARLCGLAGLSGASPKLRQLPLIGYGVVNLWHTIDPSKLASLLHNAGCNFTEIEYVAWFDDRGKVGKSTETRVKDASRFVREMRKRGITTLISLVNWNGEAQRAQDDDWYRARVREVRSQIGPNRVILLGVSEPDDQEGGKAHRWMEIAGDEWKGRIAACGDGGRGDPRAGRFDLVDWHHCEDFDAKSVRLTTAGKQTINNTDCGPVLNPGPDRVRAMAKVALSRNAHFMVYGFKDVRIDESVIDTLGQEILAQLKGAQSHEV